jgi:hypothetical protein
VAFKTKDNRLIIMVEHQSTLNENIAIRLLLYYAELLKIYISQQKLNVFGRKPIRIPSPEFYMVYNGLTDLVNSEISLKANLSLNSEFINLKVKLLDIRYDKLPPEIKDRNDVLDGYSYLMDRIRFHHQAHPLQIAIEKAIQDTLKKSYLINYLKRKEFITMIKKVMTIEEEIELIRAEEREEGIAKGMAKGMAQGIEKGIEKGIEEGKALTILEMFDEGDISFEKAKQKISTLKSSNPTASFWPEIEKSLNKLKPNKLNDPTEKYKP